LAAIRTDLPERIHLRLSVAAHTRRVVYGKDFLMSVSSIATPPVAPPPPPPPIQVKAPDPTPQDDSSNTPPPQPPLPPGQGTRVNIIA
jgi:hypothetical protein